MKTHPISKLTLLLWVVSITSISVLSSCVINSQTIEEKLTSHTPSDLLQIPLSTESLPVNTDQLLFTLVYYAGNFAVYGTEDDQQTIQDVAVALQANAQNINHELDIDFDEPIVVEIFPDQDSLDQFGMNPEMQGYYAYSGNQRIQLVSPRNPTNLPEIDYEQRVLIAVHEYVHLAINTINTNLPVWLNEGIAVYIGPHDIYTFVCQNEFPFEHVPSFSMMEQSYYSVSYADLFAYSLVEYIAREYGQEKLNRLIRSPENLEEILSESSTDFEQGWKKFMEAYYESN